MPRPTFINKFGFADPYGNTSQAVDLLFSCDNSRAANSGMVVHRVGLDSPLLKATLECLGLGECGTTSTAPDRS